MVIMLLALAAVSCGDNSFPDSTQTDEAHTSVHMVSPEVQAKIVADVTDDLRIIGQTGADTAGLSQAMNGKALTETKAAVGKDLAQGKCRKRDYQNISVHTTSFSLPVAEVSAEFDDGGYYVDANTGVALEEPKTEHKNYALAVVEEDGRWKINLILSPSATSTIPNSTDQGQTSP